MAKLTIPQIPISIKPNHDIVICSTAVGEDHCKLLNIMKPTIEYYTKLHKMDHYLLELSTPLSSRPSSWNKIILMNSLLKLYKTVIWIDSDAIICNPNYDIRNDFDPKFPVQLVTHFKITPLFPNCGFWIIQQDSRSFELLETLWNQTHAIHAGWWEQHALLELIGYQEPFSADNYKGPTKYSNWVGSLDLRWNSRDNDIAKDPIVMHFAGMGTESRIKGMTEQYQVFLKNINANG